MLASHANNYATNSKENVVVYPSSLRYTGFPELELYLQKFVQEFANHDCN